MGGGQRATRAAPAAGGLAQHPGPDRRGQPGQSLDVQHGQDAASGVPSDVLSVSPAVPGPWIRPSSARAMSSSASQSAASWAALRASASAIPGPRASSSAGSAWCRTRTAHRRGHGYAGRPTAQAAAPGRPHAGWPGPGRASDGGSGHAGRASPPGPARQNRGPARAARSRPDRPGCGRAVPPRPRSAAPPVPARCTGRCAPRLPGHRRRAARLPGPAALGRARGRAELPRPGTPGPPSLPASRGPRSRHRRAAPAGVPRGPGRRPGPANPHPPSRRPEPGPQAPDRRGSAGRRHAPGLPRGAGPRPVSRPRPARLRGPPGRASSGCTNSSLVGRVCGDVHTLLKVAIPASSTTALTKREPCAYCFIFRSMPRIRRRVRSIRPPCPAAR